jgi:hypothetical protein
MFHPVNGRELLTPDIQGTYPCAHTMLLSSAAMPCDADVYLEHVAMTVPVTPALRAGTQHRLAEVQQQHPSWTASEAWPQVGWAC